MDSNKTFTYTYSAKQQDEVKRIRQKYVSKEEDKLEQLRKLDKSAESAGSIIAVIIGVISTLLLGIGMCCTMVWPAYFVQGIIIGVVGIVGDLVTYPIYIRIVRKKRERLAPLILQLSKELMDE